MDIGGKADVFIFRRVMIPVHDSEGSKDPSEQGTVRICGVLQ